MSLADRCIVIGCCTLYAGTMTKFSWRRKSSLTTPGSLKMDSCLVLTKCCIGQSLRFRKRAIDLIHTERVSTSTSSFICQPSGILSTFTNDNAKVLVPLIWELFHVFWALAQNIFQFSIAYYIMATCHFMATWSVQKLWIGAVARWGIPRKTMKVELLQTSLLLKILEAYNEYGIISNNIQ